MPPQPDNVSHPGGAAAQATPAMRQYLEAKRQYRDAIVFFRMGDFYEMFYEDALVAARALELTLTSRSKDAAAARIPMCGVPYHAVDGYLARLVKKGFRVAICEQVEDPRKAKGLVRREVVRVVSPGTLTDAAYLDAREPAFLMAVAPAFAAPAAPARAPRARLRRAARARARSRPARARARLPRAACGWTPSASPWSICPRASSAWPSTRGCRRCRRRGGGTSPARTRGPRRLSSLDHLPAAGGAGIPMTPRRCLELRGRVGPIRPAGPVPDPQPGRLRPGGAPAGRPGRRRAGALPARHPEGRPGSRPRRDLPAVRRGDGRGPGDAAAPGGGGVERGRARRFAARRDRPHRDARWAAGCSAPGCCVPCSRSSACGTGWTPSRSSPSARPSAGSSARPSRPSRISNAWWPAARSAPPARATWSA